jgi:hypothetical protein
MKLLDSTLSQIDFFNLVSQGRTMCVNISHLHNDLYNLDYLYSLLGDKFDQLVAISGRFNIHHPHLKTFYPKIITLSDNNFEWLGNLHVNHLPTFDTKYLSNKLRCQQLWQDGEEIAFWYQPLENHWKSFINFGNTTYLFNKHFGKHGVEWIKSLNPLELEFLFDPISDVETNKEPLIDNFKFMDFLPLFLWYKLVPNKDLEKLF